MAYTLSDPFSPLRGVFRLSGTTDLILGAVMVLSPHLILTEWGSPDVTLTWPLRLAGALLIVFGVFYIIAANESIISLSSMVACTMANALMAVTLLVGYLQQEFAGRTIVGLIVLIIVFIICLIGAVAPLRYLRAEYRDE